MFFSKSYVLLALTVLLAEAFAARAMQVDRISFRVNYVKDSEKLQRAAIAAEGDEIGAVDVSRGVVARPTDSIVTQVWCSDGSAEENALFPEQALLRFVDIARGFPEPSMNFVMTEKRIEMRKELTLTTEIKKDKVFWHADGVYRVEIVVGDSRMHKGVAWTATDAFSFMESTDGAFYVKPRGVFDFDMRVKKHLLPEFISPLPAAEKEAASGIVALFTVLSVLPLGFLLLVWVRMGVFPLHLPKQRKEHVCMLLFQICLAGHVGCLGMFWLKWNIVKTWQAIGVIMVPTLYFGHHVLSAKATQEFLAEKAAHILTFKPGFANASCEEKCEWK